MTESFSKNLEKIRFLFKLYGDIKGIKEKKLKILNKILANTTNNYYTNNNWMQFNFQVKI